MTSTVLSIRVEYDEKITDPEALAAAFDTLLETAMSTPGILEEYGNPTVAGFVCTYEVPSLSSDEVVPTMTNYYFCQTCNIDWQDEWDCACDDRCPGCNKPYSPYKSEDLQHE